MKTSLLETIINFHINNGKIDKAIAIAVNNKEILSSYQWTNIIKDHTLNDICKIIIAKTEHKIFNNVLDNVLDYDSYRQKIIKNFLDYLIEKKQIKNLIVSTKLLRKKINMFTLGEMVKYHVSEGELNSGEEIFEAAGVINSAKLKKNWLKIALNQAVRTGNIELAIKILEKPPKGTVMTKNYVEAILKVFLSREETKDFSLIIRLLNYCSTTEEKEFFMNLIF